MFLVPAFVSSLSTEIPVIPQDPFPVPPHPGSLPDCSPMLVCLSPAPKELECQAPSYSIFLFLVTPDLGWQ